MKIIIKTDPAKLPSDLAADFAVKKIEKKIGKLWPWIPKMIRKACGDAYSDAMNGGRGGWFEEVRNLHMVRVRLCTVAEWEVEVYSKYV